MSPAARRTVMTALLAAACAKVDRSVESDSAIADAPAGGSGGTGGAAGRPGGEGGAGGACGPPRLISPPAGRGSDRPGATPRDPEQGRRYATRTRAGARWLP